MSQSSHRHFRFAAQKKVVVTVIPGSILRLCRLRCSTTGCRDRRTALSTRHHRLSYLLYASVMFSLTSRRSYRMCTCSKHILPTSTSCLYSYIGRTSYWRDSGRDHCRDTPSYPDSKQNPLLMSRASLCLGLCCHWGSLFGQPLFVNNTRDTYSIAGQ